MVASSKEKILLTTPDYPPKLGGLSTFTLNLEKVLRGLDISYDLFFWKGLKELIHIPKDLDQYSAVVNVHFLPSLFLPGNSSNCINFFHGSEILFFSPALVKNLVKKVMRPWIVNSLEASKKNIFISEFTLNKLTSYGYQVNYNRDQIIHNGIETQDFHMQQLLLNQSGWSFCCIARDVPHKNIQGAFDFVSLFSKEFNGSVKFYVTTERQFTNIPTNLEIINLKGASDLEIREIYKKCHFNLLFSLDHSKQGFFEGFGLTPLEAGRIGTPSLVFPSGGLCENVHTGINGFLCDGPSDFKRIIFQLKNMTSEDYLKLRDSTFHHTSKNHSLDIYKRVFEDLLKSKNNPDGHHS